MKLKRGFNNNVAQHSGSTGHAEEFSRFSVCESSRSAGEWKVAYPGHSTEMSSSRVEPPLKNMQRGETKNQRRERRKSGAWNAFVRLVSLGSVQRPDLRSTSQACSAAKGSTLTSMVQQPWQRRRRCAASTLAVVPTSSLSRRSGEGLEARSSACSCTTTLRSWILKFDPLRSCRTLLVARSLRRVRYLAGHTASAAGARDDYGGVPSCCHRRQLGRFSSPGATLQLTVLSGVLET